MEKQIWIRNDPKRFCRVTHYMCWMYFLYAKFLSVVVCLQREVGRASEELVHTPSIQHSYEIPSAGSFALEQLYPDLIKKTGNKVTKKIKTSWMLCKRFKYKVTQKIKTVEYCEKVQQLMKLKWINITLIEYFIYSVQMFSFSFLVFAQLWRFSECLYCATPPFWKNKKTDRKKDRREKRKGDSMSPSSLQRKVGGICEWWKFTCSLVDSEIGYSCRLSVYRWKKPIDLVTTWPSL